MYRYRYRVDIVCKISEYKTTEVYTKTTEDIENVCFKFKNRRIFVCVCPSFGRSLAMRFFNSELILSIADLFITAVDTSDGAKPRQQKIRQDWAAFPRVVLFASGYELGSFVQCRVIGVVHSLLGDVDVRRPFEAHAARFHAA